MDLVTISRKDYTVDRLVELNWKTDSLIWTERFIPTGDFELHTQAIADVRKLLPERSFCGLRDSDVVMRVDSHEISKNDDGVDELVVKGKSLDFILGRRVWKNAKYGKKVKMGKKYTTRQAVEVWVWNAICNGTGNDRILTDKSYDPSNQLPNVVVSDSIGTTGDGPLKARKVNNGYVLDQAVTFLKSGQFGLRIIRPNGKKAAVVHIDADGTFHADDPAVVDELRFDFYKGRDLSNRIIFSWKAGHLTEPRYLLSSENMMTGTFVDGDPRDHYYTNPDLIIGPNSGWNRLDGYVDGGQDDDLTRHDGESDADFAARKEQAADDFEDSLEDLGMKTVRREGAHLSAVDAQISPNIGVKYGRDYRLGDRVLVQGQYGVQDKKWITEFIRSQDADGEKGFPTLSSTLF